MARNWKQESLVYHEQPTPGKIQISTSKATQTQDDLSLAYTPGVAGPVLAIAEHADNAYRYTSKANLVAVISNGTAVLGLGNVGAIASKPVMEGKAVLFKRFADIDVFDIEVAATEPDEFINTVINIAPTFGGINLEDIKAPECFEIEQTLKAKLNIPVMHDDQHGTAVTAAAGLLNAIELQEKKLEEVKIVCVGAGAAGIAIVKLLIDLGAKREHILLVDSKGVIHSQRTDLNSYKAKYAVITDKRTLADAMYGADVFLGVSGPGVFSADMLATMAPKPVVFAMSNPDPEIEPAVAWQTRDDLIMATGRTDYPNQINNVLAFPYIFRGALDVRATAINSDMLKAATIALRDLAKQPVPQEVLTAYNLTELAFGKDYILPKPFDPRLKTNISQAVAQAARDTGVAKL
jgi:malate dehydrogenase (oxaloacetate-decarboxylating)(NADP+)